MKIFIDAADLNEIKKYLASGLCQGVTTNPTILKKIGAGQNEEQIRQKIIAISGLIGEKPVSVEVTSEKIDNIIYQARQFSELAANIAVKITVTDRTGNSLLPAVYQLSKEGISVNVTAITTFNQAMLASRALISGREESKSLPKFSYISVFGGRISEEQGTEQAFRVIQHIRQWLDINNFKGIEIIIGSIRSRENVELWARSGAHILTIPPEIISQCLVSARTKETVIQFMNDANGQ